MSRSSHQLLSPCRSPSGLAQYRWQSPGSLPVARQKLTTRSLFRIRPVCHTPPVAAAGALVCHPQPPEVLHAVSSTPLTGLRSSLSEKSHAAVRSGAHAADGRAVARRPGIRWTRRSRSGGSRPMRECPGCTESWEASRRRSTRPSSPLKFLSSPHCAKTALLGRLRALQSVDESTVVGVEVPRRLDVRHRVGRRHVGVRLRLEDVVVAGSCADPSSTVSRISLLLMS